MRTRLLAPMIWFSWCAIVPSSGLQAGMQLQPLAESDAGSIERLSERASVLLPQGAVVEKIADRFGFVEGPVWVPRRGDAAAHLLFSDIPNNRVHRWDPVSGAVTVEIEPVLLTALRAGGVGGSNGLLLDPHGRLVLFEHGNRRVARRSTDGTRETLVDRFDGKRLNSPNDGVFHTSGALFFTDPPYGLQGQDDDPGKELQWNGVYRLDPPAAGGKLHLLARQKRPNGIGLSPDEALLYVANSDPVERVWMVYQVNGDLSLGEGRVFFDGRTSKVPGVPDGLAVDHQGNVWATGPGGVLVISPTGEHLATVGLPELPANVAFDESEVNLYITARTGLYRLRLQVD